MLKYASILSMLAVVACLTGCAETPDSLTKAQIKEVHNLAEAIENDASEEEMKEITDRMNELGKKLEELDLSDEEKKALHDRHEDEIAEANARFLKAIREKMFSGSDGVPGMNLGPMFSD